MPKLIHDSPAESGRLEFEEFVQLAAKFIVEEDDEAMQKELREAFRLYDKQGNGYIPTSCLKEILKELDDQLTEQELDIMIEEIDSDGSGTVDFDGKCADQLAAVSRAIKILDSLARCHGIFHTNYINLLRWSPPPHHPTNEGRRPCGALFIVL